MTPDPARVARAQVVIENGEIRYRGERVAMKARFNTAYFHVLTRGVLYQVPAAAFAWYWHKGQWPERGVRQLNPCDDFSLSNLKLYRQEAPQVRVVRRLTPEEARSYTGIRSGGSK
jgi:hypothetical protein